MFLRYYRSSTSGFTLIELLMAIAIIGFLANITYGFFVEAQDKGDDAAAKSDLLSLRPEMELLYVETGNSTYVGLCTHPNIARFNTSIQEKIGAGINCDAVKDQWAVEIPLRVGGYFCIDSQGASIEDPQSKDVRLVASSTSCR
jgi:prepilin-type N-terminal cleavage/methylation domain-containing protein